MGGIGCLGFDLFCSGSLFSGKPLYVWVCARWGNIRLVVSLGGSEGRV